MSLDDEPEKTNEGKEVYKWPGVKERITKLEDEEILREAQHIQIREQMGEFPTDAERQVLTIAKRIERKQQYEEWKQKKQILKKAEEKQKD